MAFGLKRRRVLVVTGVVLLGATIYLVWIPPSGPRTLRVFDPDRMAELETRMWQSYYQKRKARLFGELVTMLHEQYRYPWAKSVRAGFHLARAAATFGDARGDYERVLPDLEQAYTIARDWTGAKFDPAAVARAELAWWVARRQPGHDSPEQVGALMADEYALLYDMPKEKVAEAALLRAQAGALRDRGGANADWPAVDDLLHRSFRSLRAAMQ